MNPLQALVFHEKTLLGLNSPNVPKGVGVITVVMTAMAIFAMDSES